MAKKLMINCGTCDARNVKEETLAAYESIVINSGNILLTAQTKDLMARYGVTMNCGGVLELEKDVKITNVNGSAQINGAMEVPDRTYLIVNGSLTIGDDAGEVLKSYVGGSINGSVTCPESLSGYLSNFDINGSTICYPDGAIVLKHTAVIDRTFGLRAKAKLYWSRKRMVMVDPQLDGPRLAAKGASFSTKEVIIAESKVESLLELIDEKAEIIIVPDGTCVIDDDVELGEITLKKYGTKLYILGDVTVDSEEAQVLEQLEYLNICGDAAVEERLKDQLMKVITQISGEVKVIKPFKGRLIGDKISLRISKWLLEQEADGIRVSDCVKVTLDEDIPNEMILQKLSLSDCVEIKCTPEQEAAVAVVAEDVAMIGAAGKVVTAGEDLVVDMREDPMGIGDMIKGALGMSKELANIKVINAGDYIL